MERSKGSKAEGATGTCQVEPVEATRKLLMRAQRAIAEVRNNETAMLALRPHEQAAVRRAYQDLADFVFGPEDTWFGGRHD